jgi:hypothetical protein
MGNVFRRWLLISWLVPALSNPVSAYTTEYLGAEYSSDQPQNLNVFYFKAAGLQTSPQYHSRISRLLIWLKQYYGQQMAANGYGDVSFGLFHKTGNPDSLRIVEVEGNLPLESYRNNGNQLLIDEVEAFKQAHPEWMVSSHTLVIVGTPSFDAMSGLPYYGLGRTCYATDYPQLSLQYLGQSGTWADRFVTYFGGMAHELGHGLNLPHSHQTLSEAQNPLKGTSLMADGNYTLTRSPTFINRAGCAILSRCEVFAQNPDGQFYNGHLAGLLSLKSRVQNGSWILSGRFVANRIVTDINFYQDPFATPSAGYARVAFSVPPVSGFPDSFYVEMPMAEVFQDPQTYPQTGPYNLEVELVLENGETSSSGYSYSYSVGTPTGNIGFDDAGCTGPGSGWTLTDIGTPLAPGKVCLNEADSVLSFRTWGAGYEQPQTDGITFLHRPIESGDTLVCRVRSVSPVWNDLAGLMVRAGLEPGSPFASISALDYRGVFWQWRSSLNGNSAYNVVTDLMLPFWLRIARQGNQIRGWYSPNGQNWTLYASRTLSLPAQALAGVVCAKNGARSQIDKLWFSGNTPVRVRPVSEQPVPFRVINPVGERLELFLPGARQEALEGLILDARGVPVFHFSVPAGAHEAAENLAGLAPGLYHLRLSSPEGFLQTCRLVIPR